MDDINWYETDEGAEFSVYQRELTILNIEADKDVENLFVLKNNLDKSEVFMMSDNLEDAKKEAVDWLVEYCESEIDFMGDIINTLNK